MITRRSIMALLGIAPALAGGVKANDNPSEDVGLIGNPAASNRDFPRDKVDYDNVGLLEHTLRSAIREFHPCGGDFGRGPQIYHGDVWAASVLLRDMGFEPYSISPELTDEFYGQPFPLYGASGGLTGLVYRVWTRQVGTGFNAKYEAVPFEYVHPSLDPSLERNS